MTRAIWSLASVVAIVGAAVIVARLPARSWRDPLFAQALAAWLLAAFMFGSAIFDVLWGAGNQWAAVGFVLGTVVALLALSLSRSARRQEADEPS